MNNCQIKNQIKNLVIVNLLNIIKKDIVFCGSLCDFFYIGLPMSNIKDIDIMVPYEKKDVIFNKIFFDNFFIPQENKKHNIKIYKTYDKITNFKREYTSYGSYSKFAFTYRYTMSLLGINLDIFPYLDNFDNKKFINKNLLHEPVENNTGKFTYELPCGARILSKNERMNSLNYYHTIGMGGEKHKIRLDKYNSLQSDQELCRSSFITDKNQIYSLPKDFSTENYLKYNDLKHKLLSRDSIISHYLSHGIQENRKYV